jgi:V/A-type H+-transporting ATPase subunit F
VAGITARAATTREQAYSALEDAANSPDCGVIIITDSVAAWIRPELEMIRLHRDHPMIVEIPGPEGPISECKSLRDLVQEAVGVRVG